MLGVPAPAAAVVCITFGSCPWPESKMQKKFYRIFCIGGSPARAVVL